MSRGSQTFRQSDLTRALKGTKAAGIDVARIKITKDGLIEIDTANSSQASDELSGAANQWDDALK
jgi:hypothetical protein